MKYQALSTPSNRLNIIDYVYLLCTCIIMLIIYLPSLRMGFTLQTIAVIGAVYGIVFFRHISTLLLPLAAIIAVWGLLNFTVAFPGNFKMGFLHSVMSWWIWILPFLMGLEMMKRRNVKVIRLCLICNLGIFLIVANATIKAMAEYPAIMRMLTSSVTDEDFVIESLMHNVGGYGLAYGTGAILVICASLLASIKLTVINRYICYGIMAVSGFIVINAQFTTLIMLCIVCISIAMWQNNNSPLAKLMIVAAAIIIIGSIQTIFRLAIDYYSDSAVGNHIAELYNSFFLNEEYESIRKDRMISAINLFFESPVWGNNIEDSQINALIVAHSHSTFWGIAARSGIIGVLCFYTMLWSVLKPIIVTVGRLGKKVFAPFILYIVLLSIFNGIDTDIFSFTIGFSSPLLVYYCNQKNTINEQK